MTVASSGMGGSAGSIRVMLVDDVDHVRRMLRNMLDLDGFDVVAESASGADALDVIDDADPDVVVIDYQMPELDGIETARRIRERRPAQVMVMYTAFLQPDVEQAAREAGVALVLGKVEGLESLEREIQRLVGSGF